MKQKEIICSDYKVCAVISQAKKRHMSLIEYMNYEGYNEKDQTKILSAIKLVK